MGLDSGSKEWRDIEEQARYIYDKKNKERSSSEGRIWAERGKNLAYMLRERYGYDDREVQYFIDRYYLDRD